MPNYAMLRLGRGTGTETAIALSKLRSLDLAELGAWAKRQRKAFSLTASEEHTIFDRYHVAYTNDVLNCHQACMTKSKNDAELCLVAETSHVHLLELLDAKDAVGAFVADVEFFRAEQLPESGVLRTHDAIDNEEFVAAVCDLLGCPPCTEWREVYEGLVAKHAPEEDCEM